MIHVLYLDDEEHNLTAFRAAFRRDFQVHVTTVPSEAVRMLQEHPIEVVISDQKMPDVSGVEFFEMIMADHPDPVRMLLTGHADIDAVIDAINKGRIYKYISKPWNEPELKRPAPCTVAGPKARHAPHRTARTWPRCVRPWRP